jgi:hypothetical protein
MNAGSPKTGHPGAGRDPMPSSHADDQQSTKHSGQFTVTLFKLLAATAGAGVISADLGHRIGDSASTALLIERRWCEQLFRRR